MSLTSVGLHLLRTGLELGSVSPLSVGPHVMVSSGLSSGGQRSHFKAVVNKAEHKVKRKGLRLFSPGRECSEMLKMTFWGIIFPALCPCRMRAVGGGLCPE